MWVAPKKPTVTKINHAMNMEKVRRKDGRNPEFKLLPADEKDGFAEMT